MTETMRAREALSVSVLAGQSPQRLSVIWSVVVPPKSLASGAPQSILAHNTHVCGRRDGGGRQENIIKVAGKWRTEAPR